MISLRVMVLQAPDVLSDFIGFRVKVTITFESFSVNQNSCKIGDRGDRARKDLVEMVIIDLLCENLCEKNFPKSAKT